MDQYIAHFYKYIAYPLMKIYWFFFRPEAFGTKVIIQYKNDFLFIQNTYRNNQWILPGGGLKKGEDPKECAIREIKEELNIDLKNIKLHGQFFTDLEFKKDNVYVLSAKVNTQELNYDRKEVAGIKWVAKTKLKSYLKNPLTKVSFELANLKTS